MSEPVSALAGARFDGFAKVEALPPRGMVTVRGDFESAALQAAVRSAVGIDVPETGRVLFGVGTAIAWLSPDELMVFCAYDAVPEIVVGLQNALADTHALVVDVSDARALFRVSGLDVREVLAKLTPADVSPNALGPGVLRRTRLAQVPAGIWMTGESAFEVMCFRSVAQYVFDILKGAAIPGSEVGYF
ncbi:sarcosine oxidase subunit gamma [Pseudoruegeria sp. HB172150]|uniref:sarcosine oxidase subunit gamma n=1 Tax=Pseudoruegeria sp. HB172150 TaxID=2721164 RepID=UPI001553480B|nr:sarcosine oxidase subunit gamma family protein [Pseudoruegeria sp. HB172150]